MAKLKERTNSEDPVPVAVTTSELIVGREKSPQFTRYFLRPNRSIFCRVTGSTARRHCTWFPQLVVSKKNFWRKKFSRELTFASFYTIPILLLACHPNIPLLNWVHVLSPHYPAQKKIIKYYPALH